MTTTTLHRLFQQLPQMRMLHVVNTKLRHTVSGIQTACANSAPKVFNNDILCQNYRYSSAILSSYHKLCQPTDSPLNVRKQQYHSLRQNQSLELMPQIQTSSLIFIRTFKMRMVLKRRCRDCYFAYEDGRKMVLCNTHPRHKQKQIMPPAKSKWILTHATSGTRRRW